MTTDLDYKPSLIRSLWHHKKSIGLYLLLTCLLFSFLRFGNPQWSKAIFIFQMYVWQVYGPEYDPLEDIPSDYSGKWYAWSSNGTLIYEAFLIDGVKEGRCLRRNVDGTKWEEQNYLHGKLHGLCTSWKHDGSIEAQCLYQNNRPLSGTVFTLNEDINEYVLRSYKDGVLVNESIYPVIKVKDDFPKQ